MSAVELAIEARARALTRNLRVGRVLPSQRRRMVGPFIFLDQMGPAEFAPGEGLDVGPHPHIGLSTLTYLFEGEILHRDSLGAVQPIRPGEVNWMTAGRGVAHSERTAPGPRASGQRLFGLQAWVALPEAQEEIAPAFAHHGRDELPVLAERGVRLRVVAGEAFGVRSPLAVHSPLFYVDAELDAGADLASPMEHEERAAYIVQGRVVADGSDYPSGRLLVFRPGAAASFRALEPSRVVLIGGAPVGERRIWWNFVSSREERIEQAKADWKAGRFPAVPDESEPVPLPQ